MSQDTTQHDNTENQSETTPTAQTHAVGPDIKTSAPRPRRATLAIIAFVVTVIGWILLPLSYQATIGAGLLGLILSILALRQPRGGWRNLTLVSLVASSVLLLVMVVFAIALYYISTL